MRNLSDKLKNVMTIGIHEDHAFLIKDIAKLAKIYVCNDCQNRFTKACNLQRHAKTCSQGETEIKCPEQKVKKPLTKYEEAFNSFTKTSPQCHEWLEKEEKRLGFHIHHASCGHGSERCLLGSPHFVEELADLGNVHVGKKANTTMFIKTPTLLFLDIINYLGPGTSYDSWIKAYGASAQKAWLPYEWLDSPDKLDYPGLPDYIHWYSKLKGEYVLKLSEFIGCRKLFRQKGMRTFRDWLEYYNNLDVAPGLQALEKMRGFTPAKASIS